MRRKIRNYTIQLIKEMVPVIVGILIALFINDWYNVRKDKEYINHVFSTINSELSETEEEIKLNIPRQLSLIDSLEHYSGNKNIRILDILIKFGGIHIPAIKMNAWKSVSSSKIDLIDYDKITSLSNIEEKKELLKIKREYLMNFLYSNLNETEKDKKEFLKIIISDIIQTEQLTQKCIEDFR